MNFYTNVHQYRDRMLVIGYKDGKKYQEEVQYEPYLFVQTNKKTPYKTLAGKPVEKKVFDNTYQARDYFKKYEGIHGYSIYGLTRYMYAYINDTYKGDVVDYDVELVKSLFLDIEVAVDEGSGFPNVLDPKQVVNAITVYHDEKYTTWAFGDYVTDKPNRIYIKCKDEHELLTRFVNHWSGADIDIVTGWNVMGFDMPYLINRIRKICGEEVMKRLSPWGMIESREVELMGRTVTQYTVVGVSILDYLELYKKHSYTPQESYRLDHISNYELGLGKLDYSEYDSLFDLYKKNHQKFIEYNIVDVERVVQLDAKLKFIEMVLAIAYNGKVNYQDTFTSVKMWEVIIHNYLLSKNIVVPNEDTMSKDRQIAGGYVKDPQNGFHKWVVSFDLNSLYPHLIMMYNIGPDTYVDTLPGIDPDVILEGLPQETRALLLEDDTALAATGCRFSRGKRGFLAELMNTMYDDRVRYKKEMLTWKQELELVENEIKRRTAK